MNIAAARDRDDARIQALEAKGVRAHVVMRARPIATKPARRAVPLVGGARVDAQSGNAHLVPASPASRRRSSSTVSLAARAAACASGRRVARRARSAAAAPRVVVGTSS